MVRAIISRWASGSWMIRGCTGLAALCGVCAFCTFLFLAAQKAGIIPEPTRSAARAEKTPTQVAAAFLTATAQTWTPTSAPLPSTTPAVTWTASKTPIATWTRVPSLTPPPSATQLPLTLQPQTIYASSSANLRPCPRTTADCSPKDQVQVGAELAARGQIAGESIGGNALWYQVTYGGQLLYIHSSVVSTTRPAFPAPAVLPPSDFGPQPPGSPSAVFSDHWRPSAPQKTPPAAGRGSALSFARLRQGSSGILTTPGGRKS